MVRFPRDLDEQPPICIYVGTEVMVVMRSLVGVVSVGFYVRAHVVVTTAISVPDLVFAALEAEAQTVHVIEIKNRSLYPG